VNGGQRRDVKSKAFRRGYKKGYSGSQYKKKSYSPEEERKLWNSLFNKPHDWYFSLASSNQT